MPTLLQTARHSGDYSTAFAQDLKGIVQSAADFQNFPLETKSKSCSLTTVSMVRLADYLFYFLTVLWLT